MNTTFRSLAGVVFLSLGVAAFSGETAEVYKSLYQNTDSMDSKAALITSIIALNDPEVAPALAMALEDLVRLSPTVKKGSERETFDRAVRMTVGYLGTYRHMESIPMIWEALGAVQDPLAKAEAVMALGSLRAVEYTERLALMLRNINFTPGDSPDKEEKIAFGLVIALEKMRSIDGFIPVFHASVGWYGKRVREQAARSLLTISDDPTAPVLTLLVEQAIDGKIIALELEAKSRASPEGKIEAARLALKQGHFQAAKDKRDAVKAAILRVKAMTLLIELKAGGGSSVENCVESFKLGQMDEQLVALQALAADASDTAAKALSDIIIDFNQKQISGIVDEVRNRLVMAAIQNAGMMKNKLLRPCLLLIQSNTTWSGSIITAAGKALASL